MPASAPVIPAGPARVHASAGFTLIELAIVMFLVALALGGMMTALSTARDVADVEETEKQLAAITERLLAFATANGRLPCPATPTSNGTESFCTDGPPLVCGGQTLNERPHGRCILFEGGFLPAATLGITPTDTQGFAIDRWGNRIRYAVSDGPFGTAPFALTARPTASSGLTGVWANSPAQLLPDLRVCRTAATISNPGLPAADCAAADRLAASAAAVIVSTGKNGRAVPTSADEQANATVSDRVFVSRPPSAADSGLGEFDDIVAWVSPQVIVTRLLQAGRLP